MDFNNIYLSILVALMLPHISFQVFNPTIPVRISPLVAPSEGQLLDCPSNSTIYKLVTVLQYMKYSRSLAIYILIHILVKVQVGRGWHIFNMTQAGQSCPSNLTTIYSPVRGCTRK